jgi:transposase
VVEVNRPDRAARRRQGKSDPLDAEAAARAAQAEQGSMPKAGDGLVEMIRLLRVARRYQALTAEIVTLDAELDRLTATAAPKLLALFGIGSDSAGALLVAAGGNPARLRSDTAFAMLCGASPLEASSGKVRRHRLNRGGDRQANAALYRIVVARLRHHQQTRDYLARRLSEGKSKKEAIRCLKRYVAREVFAVLQGNPRPQPAILQSP